MRTKKMHPVAQYREDNDFLKQNAGFLFKYRKLIQGHAWFPYVPVPLQIPGIKRVPLGALLELAGDSSEEFCLLCENATWWKPIIMDGIPDKLEVITDPEIDIESPSSLFLSLKERADAQLDVIRNRVRALSELCAQYNHADAVPPKSDLREVVASLKRAGHLAYLTDAQVKELRKKLTAFNVYDSLEEMEEYLINTYLDEMILDLNRGCSLTLCPFYFRYYWSQDASQHHFTAHYAQNRNVCIFTGTEDNIINSVWYMKRYQEEYLESLFIANFDVISIAIREAVKSNPDIEIEVFKPETHVMNVVHDINKSLPVMTLWEVIEERMKDDSYNVIWALDDGGDDVCVQELERMWSLRRKVIRKRFKKEIPAHASLFQRIIGGIATDAELDQCVELWFRIDNTKITKEEEEDE